MEFGDSGLNSQTYFKFLKIYFQVKQLIEEKDNTIKNTLSFAWKESDNYARFYKDVCNDIRNTEKLVIIGYSFPDFNSEIDYILIKEMQSLKKIYIQTLDENESTRKIKNILSKVNLKVEFEIVNDCHNFLTPSNL